ncbi:MAG: hypothetical protein K8I00_11650, partial [Candidatus Omnitrophica bacterium]|nr:hypothetical protein [Candidatus Omnitrophota bacterium]
PCTNAMSPPQQTNCKEDGINIKETPTGRQELSYKDGKPDGVTRIYDLNGVLMQERHYTAGKFLFDRYFDENGKPQQGEHIEKFRHNNGIHYKRDYADGFLRKSITYFPNGNIDRELYFEDGRNHGDTKYYYESGQLKKKVSWVDGVAIGSMKTFFKGGQLRKEEILVGGEKAHVKQYDKKGRVVAEYPFIRPDKFEPVDLKEVVFDGSGDRTMFFGDWSIRSSMSQGLGRKTDDQFLDMKSDIEFFPDGTCEIYSYIKGRKVEQVRKKYRVEDGRLILESMGDRVSIEFAFMDEGLRLALKTKHIIMLMARQ